MASLKCLACGHDNKVGDESCASCASSLNLRLCSACEAINATNAERCHSCGALFGAAAEPPPALEEVTEERADAPRIEKPLPAAWIAGAARASRGDRRLRAALWVVPVLAVGSAAYYFYGAPQAAPAKRPVVEVKRAAPLAQRPKAATPTITSGTTRRSTKLMPRNTAPRAYGISTSASAAVNQPRGQRISPKT